MISGDDTFTSLGRPGSPKFDTVKKELYLEYVGGQANSTTRITMLCPSDDIEGTGPVYTFKSHEDGQTVYHFE